MGRQGCPRHGIFYGYDEYLHSPHFAKYWGALVGEFFMKHRSRTLLYLLFTDWIIIVGSFAIALRLRHYDPGMNIISRSHIIPQMSTMFLYAFVMIGVFSAMELYKRKILLSPLQQLLCLLKASITTVISYILIKTLLKSDLFIPSRLVLLQWGAFLLFGLCVNRLIVVHLLIHLFSKTDFRRRVVVIGATDLAQQLVSQCRKNNNKCGIQIVGIMDEAEKAKEIDSLPFLGTPETLPDVIDLYHLEGAVICNPDLSHQKLIDMIETCIRLFGWVDIHSERSAALQRSGSADAYFDIPFIRMHGISNNPLYKSWKRTFDFLAALFGIIILSPLLIGTAIAIKITSPGPIFYTRERIGKNGKPFLFYKFRSMSVGADQDQSRAEEIRKHIQDGGDQKQGKVINTAYVTPVGKLIRKWAIDELPQLFNVLKGDMALVGPRPIPPSEYAHEDEWHQRRFAISPGCTGLWKIYASRVGVTFNDTVLYDIFYARNMNPTLDMVIILGTVSIILTGRADGYRLCV